MAADALAIVGLIRNAQGIRGEVVIEPLTDAPDAVFASGRRVFVDDDPMQSRPSMHSAFRTRRKLCQLIVLLTCCSNMRVPLLNADFASSSPAQVVLRISLEWCQRKQFFRCSVFP